MSNDKMTAEQAFDSKTNDPVCGNCFKKKSEHYFEDGIYCYTETTGDIFTDEPAEHVVLTMLADKRPELYDLCVAEWRYKNGHSAVPPQALSAPRVPDFLNGISNNLRIQNNRITQDPLFVVFEKRSFVVDESFDYDSIVWCDDEGSDATDEVSERLDAIRDDVESDHYLGDEINIDGSSWRRLAIKEYDHFVTACFTEAGANAYLKANGHNLRSPFIYVTSLFRNEEMKAIRNWMMSLAASPEPVAATEKVHAVSLASDVSGHEKRGVIGHYKIHHNGDREGTVLGNCEWERVVADAGLTGKWMVLHFTNVADFERDWSMLEAAQDSLREHAAMLKYRDSAIADLRAEVEAMKAKLEELEAFRSAIVGWREWDWPEWFSRATAEHLAYHGKSQQMITAANQREGGE